MCAKHRTQEVQDRNVTAQYRQDSKYSERDGHRGRGFMDVMLHFVTSTILSEKSHEQKPEHIESGHASANRPHQPQGRRAKRTSVGFLENQIFTKEPSKPRDTSNREAGNKKGPE